MKRRVNYLVVLVITLFGLTLQSCSSEDELNTENPETFIRFTVNGTDYEFADIITAESNSITLNGNNGEGIANAGDTRLAVWLPLVLEKGTFELENSFSGTYKISFTSESLAFDFEFARIGSITLTQTTGEFIEGTFTATVVNSGGTEILITNGVFKAFNI